MSRISASKIGSPFANKLYEVAERLEKLGYGEPLVKPSGMGFMDVPMIGFLCPPEELVKRCNALQKTLDSIEPGKGWQVLAQYHAVDSTHSAVSVLLASCSAQSGKTLEQVSHEICSASQVKQ